MIALSTEVIFGEVNWCCLSRERLTGAASEMEAVFTFAKSFQTSSRKAFLTSHAIETLVADKISC